MTTKKKKTRDEIDEEVISGLLFDLDQPTFDREVFLRNMKRLRQMNEESMILWKIERKQKGWTVKEIEQFIKLWIRYSDECYQEECL
jgi:hypothetical protein